MSSGKGFFVPFLLVGGAQHWLTQRTASRVVWSEHLLFLSSVTVFRVVVFSEVANCTVSGKTQEIQLVFVKSLVYGLEGLYTEEVSGSLRRWRRLVLVKFTCLVLPVLPGEPQEQGALSHTYQMYINQLLGQSQQGVEHVLGKADR